jgi:hypothetical protein
VTPPSQPGFSRRGAQFLRDQGSIRPATGRDLMLARQATTWGAGKSCRGLTRKLHSSMGGGQKSTEHWQGLVGLNSVSNSILSALPHLVEVQRHDGQVHHARLHPARPALLGKVLHQRLQAVHSRR